MTEKSGYQEPDVTGIRTRNEKVWADVYMQLRNQVIVSVSRRLGDPALAEDIYQEAFRKAHEVAENWGNLEINNFRAWIFRIAQAKATDVLRSRNRRTILYGEEAEQLLENIKVIDKLDESAELHRIMDNAINQLTPEQQIVIRLRYFAELSYAEIANRLGVNIGAVKGRLNRAQQKLGKNSELIEYNEK